MYNKRKVGAEYEQLAVEYLKANGYTIIEQNFRCKTGEIDIIAKEDGYLIFVEVKYRTNTSKGLPHEAITVHKMKKISHTAQFYMLKNQIPVETPCRFDVVVILNQNLELIKNAFETIM